MAEDFMLMERRDEPYVEQRVSPPPDMALALANFSGNVQKVESQTPIQHNEPFPPGTSEFPCGMQPATEHDLFYCRHMNCSFRAEDRPTLEDHEKSHRSKVFQCDVCYMRFTLLANMQRHKLSHFGVRPFECRLCPKRFFRKDHLMEHLVRQHSKQRPYRCPFCIKSFNSRPHLKSHLSSDHSGSSLGKVCNLCGYRASSLASAKAHYNSCHLKAPPISVYISPMIQPSADLKEISDNTSMTNTTDSQLSPEALIDNYPTRCSAPPILPPAALGAPPDTPMNIYPVNSPNSVSSSYQRPLDDRHVVKHEQPDADDNQSTCSSSILPSSTMEPHDTFPSSAMAATDGPNAEDPPDNPSNQDFKPCQHRADSSRENGEGKVTTSFRNEEMDANGTEAEDIKPLHRTEHRVKVHGRGSSSGSCSNQENDYFTCTFCGIVFPDRTLYFLHRGLHSTADPWRCNLCGEQCRGKYDFNSHLISQAHR